MRKRFLTAVIVCTCFLGIMVSVSAAASQAPSSSTPLKFSFWPGVFSWPSGLNVYGLSLGLPASDGESDCIVGGVDAAIVLSKTPNVKGIQLAFVSIGKDSAGVQFGVANAADNIEGMQAGIFNDAINNSTFFQIGLINKSKKSRGLQIGLLNFMDNGMFPVFPLFNYSK